MATATTGDAIDAFEEVVALAPDERPARLAELAATDAALAERVRRMLAADGATTPLDRDELFAAAAAAASELPAEERVARRHLHGQPVAARPASLASRARKLVRRHRLLVTTAAVVAAVVLSKAGHLDEAGERLSQAEAAVREPYQRQSFLLHRGTLALLEGRLADAVEHLRSARRISDSQGHSYVETPALVIALVRAGRVAEAERAAAVLEAGEVASSSPLKHAEVRVALAHLRLGQDRLADCESTARNALAAYARELERPTTAATAARTILGECLLAGPHPATAVPLLDTAHRFLAERYGSDLWETRRVGELLRRARAAAGER